MTKKTYLYISIQLLLVLCFLNSNLNGQKIIIDTFTYSQYGVYCEGVKVCEYLVPDSIFQKLNGRPPNEVKHGPFKYQKYCYNLGYDAHGQLYSFKDFELRIGNNSFEFSYPQYTFILSKQSFCENIKIVKLFSHKTNKTYEVKTLILSIDFGKNKRFDLPSDEIKLNEFLKTLKDRNSTIRLKLEPIEYPNNKEKCGNVRTYFPALDFNLL